MAWNEVKVFKKLKISHLAIFLLLINLLGFNHILEVRNEEPRRAIVSIEMMESGEYAAPQIYGEPYYNKPPLYNWILAGSFAIFGNGEWALRLPGVVFFMLIGGLIYFFAKIEFKPEIALLMAFAFLTGGDLLFFGSVNAGEIDLFYSFVVVLQALLIYHFGKQEKYLQLFVFSYLLTAVGVLTKGIPSLAFQALTLLVYFIVYKKFWKLFSWQHILSILIFVSIIGGYFWYYGLENDLYAFLSQQFKEASQRTGNEHGWSELLLQILIFPLTIIEKLFPWSLLGLTLLIKEVRKNLLTNPFLKFSLVFIAANIFIYWTAPHLRVRYIYMFFPFFLMLAMGGLANIDWNHKILKIPKAIYIFGIFAIGVAFSILPWILGMDGLLSIIFGILFAAILILIGFKALKYRGEIKMLWFLIVALLIGRLGYNVIVIPEMSELNKDLNCRYHVDEIISKSLGRDVYLAGGPEVIQPDVQILGHVLYAHDIAYPPGIPFQIPYYYTNKTGKLISYNRLASDRESVYLIYEHDLWMISEEIIELYSFEANNTRRELILFEYK